ncbi:MAG TPA: hypothetical protein PKI46_03410 [Bacteroidales bacterium]|nr:hypothetical protein [Bacteroidales bacterium]
METKILEKNDVKDLINKSKNDFYLANIRPSELFSKEDISFFVAKKEEIKKTFTNTYMWRTDGQKRSIINDFNFPTIHSKFHQALLEQKVQLNETLELSKAYEETLLEVEDLGYELEELHRNFDKEVDELQKKRLSVAIRKKELELQYKNYALENQKIACNYRMKEVKGWENIKDSLFNKLKEHGYTEEEIYNKETGEVETQFFTYLNNYLTLENSTNAAEVANLTASALFAIQQAIDTGMIDRLLNQCNPDQINGLKKLGLKIELKK